MENPKYEVFKDSPVLDILHICFQDLEYGRMTPKGRLERLMLKAYSEDDPDKIREIIKIMTVNTTWFSEAGPNIHLTERGVEIYINTVQLYSAQKQAEEATLVSQKADRKMTWSIAIAVGSLLVGLVALCLDHISLIQKIK